MSGTEHHPINLSRVQRCDQAWSAMEAIPGGRLCQRCCKRIVDFTRMSNAAIAQMHMESMEPVCGMYRVEQLRSPLVQGRSHTGWRRHPARFSLVSLLLLEPLVSTAQEVPVEQVVLKEEEHAEHGVTVPDAAAATGSVVLRGRVTEGGEPVPFVTVFVKGTPLGTTTDFEGRFALDVTELGHVEQQVVLVMQYIGYTTMEQEVDLVRPDDVWFKVEEAEVSLISYSVTYERPPLYKRIWWGMQRPFRK